MLHTCTPRQLSLIPRSITYGCFWSSCTSFTASLLNTPLGFPGATNGKEPTCQCRRHEMGVQSLDQEDPLKEGMITHSSIHAWRIPWTVEPGRLQRVAQSRRQLKWLSTHASLKRKEWSWYPADEGSGFGSRVPSCRLEITDYPEIHNILRSFLPSS